MEPQAAGAKGKPKLSHAGFQFQFMTKRKDGSETWRCIYKDCDARMLKKLDGGKETLTALKDHSIELELSNSAAVHLTLNCIKQRALKNPDESTKDVITAGINDAKELIIASIPGPSTIEDLIKNWRADAANGGVKTPRRKSTKDKENTPDSGRKTIAPRKRAKLTEANKDESPARTPKAKRGRAGPKSQSQFGKYVDDEESEEDPEDSDLEDEDEDDE